jgi:alkanesulfonate monooxygenase SsuD/methylene tetrahydromethanopterin reductase-like flavin-dependent oxidoreductase (luciferase family)
VTTYPRPVAGPFRIRHGSATSTAAVDLAAKWGDPIFFVVHVEGGFPAWKAAGLSALEPAGAPQG